MKGTLKNQVAVNLGATFVKSLTVIISIWLADLVLSAAALGFILLFRRQAALWSNLAQLGLTQALKKFYIAEKDGKIKGRIWRDMMWVVLCVSLLFVMIGLFFGKPLASYLLGSEDAILGLGLALYVVALTLGLMAYSSWQSEFEFLNANIVDWFNGSLIFLACVIGVWGGDGFPIVSLLVVVTMISSFFALLGFQRKYIPADKYGSPVGAFYSLYKDGKLTFGAYRGLTSFFDIGVLAIGPWLIRDAPEDVGALIIAYTVMRFAQTLILPVAQVLSLRANSYLYSREEEDRRVVLFLIISVCGGVGVVLGYYLVGDLLLYFWLANSSEPVRIILDEIIVCVPALCCFYALRNYLEIKYYFPWNLLVLILAISMMMIVYYSSVPGLNGVVGASKVMFFVMASTVLVFLFGRHANKMTRAVGE